MPKYDVHIYAVVRLKVASIVGDYAPTRPGRPNKWSISTRTSPLERRYTLTTLRVSSWTCSTRPGNGSKGRASRATRRMKNRFKADEAYAQESTSPPEGPVFPCLFSPRMKGT